MDADDPQSFSVRRLIPTVCIQTTAQMSTLGIQATDPSARPDGSACSTRSCVQPQSSAGCIPVASASSEPALSPSPPPPAPVAKAKAKASRSRAKPKPPTLSPSGTAPNTPPPPPKPKASKAKSKATPSDGTKPRANDKKAPPIEETIGLFEYIEMRRQVWVQLRQDAPKLRLLADLLDRACSQMLGRWQTQRRNGLRLQAEKCRELAHNLESGAFEDEFERTVQRFLAYVLRLRETEGIVIPLERAASNEEQQKQLDRFLDHLSLVSQTEELENSENGTEVFRPGDGDSSSSLNSRNATLARQLEQQLLREFMCVGDDVPPPVQCHAQDYCVTCGEPMKVRPSEGLLVCTWCGEEAQYLDATSALTAYGEEVEIQTYNYKRRGHFGDKMAAFRAEESTVIPRPVLRQIMTRLYQEGYREVDKLTLAKIQDTMKQLRLRHYYDNKMQVACLITGKKPPFLASQDEERCRRMFDALQEPYERHRPPGRYNFINYNYCIFSFFRMLGLWELLPYFELLKSDEKLAETEEVFAKICRDLDWEFSPVRDAKADIEAQRLIPVPEGTIAPGERSPAKTARRKGPPKPKAGEPIVNRAKPAPKPRARKAAAAVDGSAPKAPVAKRTRKK